MSDTETPEQTEETAEVTPESLKAEIKKATDGLQINLNKRFKTFLSELAELTDEHDPEKLSLRDLQRIVKDQVGQLKTQATGQPDVDGDKLKSQLEAQFRAEYEQKQNELLSENKKSMIMNDVRAEAIRLGLNDEFKNDLFGSMFEQYFEVDISKEGVYFKDKSKDAWVLNDQGEPAKAGELAERFRQHFPSAFSTIKEGLGLQGRSNGAKSSFDPLKTPTQDILNMAFKNRE